jgi:alpha-ketoglutarate-dependent 2,4-dichlorophenoxyacetate dioxygenase
MTLQVRPILPRFGAEVSGLDLTRPLSEAERKAVLEIQGVALLRELTEHATQPSYVFAISYQPGDLVIWDNLCTMHRGGKFDEIHHRRDMRRTSVREQDAPAGFDDQFTDLYKTAGIMPFSKANPTH